ncbi:MAG: hypothetical protein R3E79_23420 [Caldilineaceae bacterium]
MARLSPVDWAGRRRPEPIPGHLFGGLSGYYGGSVDLLIERVIEFLRSLPTIPVWMARWLRPFRPIGRRFRSTLALR